MKKTLTTYEIAEDFIADDNANWSRAGALALAKYLEEHEESTGEELELDVVAIRCDFAEYKSLQAWAHEYFSDFHGEMKANDLDANNDDEVDDWIREYCEDNGQVIEFDGGVIVSAF